MSIRLFGVLIPLLLLPVLLGVDAYADEGQMCRADSLMCEAVAENEVCLGFECVLEVQAGKIEGDVIHVADAEVLEVEELSGVMESEEVEIEERAEDLDLAWDGEIDVLTEIEDVMAKDVEQEIENLAGDEFFEDEEVLPVVREVQVVPVEELVFVEPRLNVSVIEELINQHREAIGKPRYARDERLCSIAQVRAMEAEAEMWGGKGMHVGLNARSEGFRIRENLISMQTEEKAFNWWLNSPVHRAGIEGDFVYSCGACSGRNCVQLFTNWEERG